MDEETYYNAEAGPSTPPSLDPATTVPTSYPSPPIYDFSNNPRSTARLDAASLKSQVQGNFFRRAQWCSDGSSILATSEDRVLRVLHYESSSSPPPDSTSSAPSQLLKEPRAFPQPDAITSTAWYPSATRRDAGTFCFAAGVRESPVRLVDAEDGRVRATYPIIDHRERFISPHSLAFNADATRLYCGCDSFIEVFDVAVPGHGNGERINTSGTKKEKNGLKGLVSALAFSHLSPGLYAAGTFNGAVSLFSEGEGGAAVGHLQGIQGGGVTQIAFHPLSSYHIIASSRRSSAIQIFDTRDTSAPLAALERKGHTNQRLWFDVDPWGRYLASGDTEGVVSVWSMGEDFGKALFEQKLYDDAVGSVGFHPFEPVLLVASGSRSNPTLRKGDRELSDSSSDSSDESSDEQTDNTLDGLDVTDPMPAGKCNDPSLAIWSFASEPPPSLPDIGSIAS